MLIKNGLNLIGADTMCYTMRFNDERTRQFALVVRHCQKQGIDEFSFQDVKHLVSGRNTLPQMEKRKWVELTQRWESRPNHHRPNKYVFTPKALDNVQKYLKEDEWLGLT